MHPNGSIICLLTKTVSTLHTRNTTKSVQHLVRKLTNRHHASHPQPQARRTLYCSVWHSKQRLLRLLNPAAPSTLLIGGCSRFKWVHPQRCGAIPGLHSDCTCRLSPGMQVHFQATFCPQRAALIDFLRHTVFRNLSSSNNSSDSGTEKGTNKDSTKRSPSSGHVSQKQNRASKSQEKNGSSQAQSGPSQEPHANMDSISQEKTVSFQERSHPSMRGKSQLQQKIASKQPEIIFCDESCPGPAEHKRLPRSKSSPSHEQTSASLVLQKQSSMMSQEPRQSSVISQEQSSVMAQEQKSVIPQEQNSLVSQEQGSLMAQEQKSVIPQEQNSLVSQEQGSLMAQEPTSLVQRNGGGGEDELPITVWGVRLANENCYLAWCRNSYLMAIISIVLMGPGSTFLIKAVGAGLLVLSAINITWGTYCYIHNLIFLRIQVGMTRLAVFAQVMMATVHLALCLFFGLLYLDDVPGKPVLGGGKKDSTPSTPNTGLSTLDSLPEGWELGPGSEERRTMIRDWHIISGKKKPPPTDGQ